MSKIKMLSILLLFYGLYIVAGMLGGVYLSDIPEASVSQAVKETDERVALVESGEEAWHIRREMITQAETSLDIATFSFQGGESVELYYALLLEAANRGVSVRLLLDGVFHGMRLTDRRIYEVFLAHENIEVGMYEPLNPFKPWTFNNRMHDKLMIADNRVGLTGGRNIGDKYFDEKTDGVSYDREIVVMGKESRPETLVMEMADYFQKLWTQPYVSKRDKPVPTLTGNWRIERTAESLKDRVDNYHLTSLIIKDTDYWLDKSHAAEKGLFVHNGLERFNKEPAVWKTMLNQLAETEESFLLKSPYVIMDTYMIESSEQFLFEPDKLTIVTNGIQATPNYLAHSGYRNNRDDLIESEAHVKEYQSENSSLHMKSFVQDDKWVGIGSFNLDPRSVYLNTESMLMVKSEELADEVLSETDKRYGDKLEHAAEGVESKSAQETSRIKKLVIDSLRPLTMLIERLL
ncbi:phospholipase D-like domain-containing protein [Alkalibacterium sp.]|nr:MAG: phospholipase D family protein [Alkalibacterium sp.]